MPTSKLQIFFAHNVLLRQMLERAMPNSANFYRHETLLFLTN
jgi:hypothetical protein